MTHDATRAHIRNTTLISVATGAAGAAVGVAAGGWHYGLAVAATTGGGALLGGYMARNRAAQVFTAVECATALGYADGLAHGVLAAVSNYEAAVFPVSPGGVTEDERAGRRAVAYRLAAADGLPGPVRMATADALAALDEGSELTSAAAVRRLFAAVHRQTSRR
ncbi:hypothetical protein ACFYW9_23070 [Streptomyces sp. NPDC002698]|uniref:hypothetical protein n=1 Tax=Streptomyces sp. NPDC002698 TaxID=3364660 RepID=UPI0036B4D868